ncbi:MAG: hypothetical protein EOP83_21305 [Verrucomicrobiaceae bacterium]|nr:MAG: hypothetical protein EOP83_21305 [Verrucomicrobiaceae bacterium]
MKSEITQGLRCVAALAICVALSSCGDDPELVKKREQQKAEISKLSGELSILKERLESIPPDKAVNIEELKEKAENNRTQIASLETEVEALGKEKAEIEKQHQAYKRKYIAK